MIRIFVVILSFVVLGGCATAPPKNQSNLCEIFREKPDWYDDALDMQEEWGTPIQVSMAFIKQESSFRHDARPPKDYLLGIIPWGRVSSAYGYAQAQDPAWEDFQKATNHGGSRTDFADALMFVGWYTDATQKQLGVSKWDAYNQYLAYHEGRGGFKRKSYQGKPSLVKVARKVEQQAKDYGWQLKQCRQELEDNRSWLF
ncbi:transglycosylase SLT domain-containing protein [Vibrio bivalvicida]|uniref:Transglycosylase SLT domain-containing protein n=1 Tax=Vibrio bivalvicida TaxID=1276888 RepID=A0ABV4MMR7_9VIBR